MEAPASSESAAPSESAASSESAAPSDFTSWLLSNIGDLMLALSASLHPSDITASLKIMETVLAVDYKTYAVINVTPTTRKYMQRPCVIVACESTIVKDLPVIAVVITTLKNPDDIAGAAIMTVKANGPNMFVTANELYGFSNYTLNGFNIEDVHNQLRCELELVSKIGAAETRVQTLNL
jgi:hypothetical protein